MTVSEFQFVVDQTGLEAVRKAPITANFQECREALIEMMAPYAGMVVTEDGITGAKADLAKIRKTSKAINDARIRVKKAYMEPFEGFELDCKALVEICDRSAMNISKQVNAFTEEKANEKIARLRIFFEEVCDPVRQYLTFEQVYNQRWRNTTFGEEQAKAAIYDAVQQTKSDIEGIKTLMSPYEDTLLKVYTDTLDVSAVLKRDRELREVARLAEEKKQRDLEELRERAARDAQARAVQDKETQPEAEAVQAQTPSVQAPPNDDGAILTVDFRVKATKTQLAMLGLFLRDNGIAYGKVPKEK